MAFKTEHDTLLKAYLCACDKRRSCYSSLVGLTCGWISKGEIKRRDLCEGRRLCLINVLAASKFYSFASLSNRNWNRRSQTLQKASQVWAVFSSLNGESGRTWTLMHNIYRVPTTEQVDIISSIMGSVCFCCFSRLVLEVKFSINVTGSSEKHSSEETGAWFFFCFYHC